MITQLSRVKIGTRSRDTISGYEEYHDSHRYINVQASNIVPNMLERLLFGAYDVIDVFDQDDSTGMNPVSINDNDPLWFQLLFDSYMSDDDDMSACQDRKGNFKWFKTVSKKRSPSSKKRKAESTSVGSSKKASLPENNQKSLTADEGLEEDQNFDVDEFSSGAGVGFVSNASSSSGNASSSACASVEKVSNEKLEMSLDGANTSIVESNRKQKIDEGDNDGEKKAVVDDNNLPITGDDKEDKSHYDKDKSEFMSMWKNSSHQLI